MSQETSKWLNEKVLIGFGRMAWHYDESLQGSESNHYPGAIPPEDVIRRLDMFGTAFIEGTLSSDYIGLDGQPATAFDNDRKTIIHPYTGDILNVVKDGFKVHDYELWLIETAREVMAGNELGIGSAGLLKKGAVAWVQFEMPEDVSTPEGVTFRPFFTAATSVDSSLSSTYTRGSTLTVCDNTLSAAIRQAVNKYKRKHSRNSIGDMGEVRRALELIDLTAQETAGEIRDLCEIKVSDKEWSAFLDAHLLWDKLPEKGRARTTAGYHRDALNRLWNNDNRVSPWKGTAFGAVQAVNTYEHHEKTVKGISRPERNMQKMVMGDFDKLDPATFEEVMKVKMAMA